jgi:hypothetical protein
MKGTNFQAALAIKKSKRADGIEVVSIVTRGARGTLWASMAAVGNEHGLRIRIYGEQGSLGVWTTIEAG